MASDANSPAVLFDRTENVFPSFLAKIGQAVASGRHHVVAIEGDPKSKARPRIWAKGSRHGVYTPSKPFENALAAELALKLTRHGPFAAGVAICAIFYRSNHQRIDVDNMLKLVLDAGTKAGLWADDSQVTALLGAAEFDPHNPRTVICFAEYESSLARGDDVNRECPSCKREFRPPHFTSRRRYCSPRCKAAARGQDLSEPVPCGVCKKPFRRKTTTNKLCSPACRTALLKSRPRPVRKPLPKCEGCGVELSRYGYKRCRNCWKRARTNGVA